MMTREEKLENDIQELQDKLDIVEANYLDLYEKYQQSVNKYFESTTKYFDLADKYCKLLLPNE